jgi:hypothetical protein
MPVMYWIVPARCRCPLSFRAAAGWSFGQSSYSSVTEPRLLATTATEQQVDSKYDISIPLWKCVLIISARCMGTLSMAGMDRMIRRLTVPYK